MSELDERLKKLLSTHNLITGNELFRKREALEQRRQAGDFDIDKCVQGQEIENECGKFFLVRRDFPLDAEQGNIKIGAVLDCIPEHIAITACDPDLEEFNPAETCFIDTETTGLSGGTGTMAFLVGVGYFADGMFRLEQCLMRDFDEEEAMLHHLNGIFARCNAVVSFNGKSFDVPLLRTRFISNRQPFRLDAALHFDLLHAARRIWKLRLKDCSLGNVEREVLGIQRTGDIPSAEIPQIWFDYIRTRDARLLKRVFQHHRMDILSLPVLTALLSQCVETPDGEDLEHAEDRLSLIRLHFRQKRYPDVITHAQKLLETENETEDFVRKQCLELLAFAFKRTQDWRQMADTLELMAREFPSDALSRHELAKLYEHRMRNLPAAKKMCEEAIQHLETRANLEIADEFETMQIQAFRSRLERIQRKLSKGRMDPDES
jgi:uncharacterized protein YprB with RNaseH-like and TPR domain